MGFIEIIWVKGKIKEHWKKQFPGFSRPVHNAHAIARRRKEFFIEFIGRSDVLAIAGDRWPSWGGVWSRCCDWWQLASLATVGPALAAGRESFSKAAESTNHTHRIARNLKPISLQNSSPQRGGLVVEILMKIFGKKLNSVKPTLPRPDDRPMASFLVNLLVF